MSSGVRPASGAGTEEMKEREGARETGGGVDGVAGVGE
jgi:hypothetical protein